MENGALLKKVKAGARIVFDSPDKLCLILQGRINTAAPGQRQEIGPGGVINSQMYAYAIEESELLFINLEKLKEIKPDLAARLMDNMKEPEKDPEHDKPSAKHGGTVYLYSTDVQCPVCEEQFQAYKLFESKLKRLNHDTELRTRFEDIEPIHYKIWVCPNCLYANFINRFPELAAPQKIILKESIGYRKSLRASLPEPCGDMDTVINNYQLAVECLTKIGAAQNSIASAWLNLAWLYDDKGDTDLALTARKNSLDAYEQFYFEERSLTPQMELQALYIIGELNKRLGNLKKAHEYFLKVLHYKDHHMAILAELARDSLQELKKMAKETA